MGMAGIEHVIIALGVVLLLIAGLAAILRRLRLTSALTGIASAWGVTPQTQSCRVGRNTTLSIVTLGDFSFVVMNGPRSDQVQLLPTARHGNDT